MKAVYTPGTDILKNDTSKDTTRMNPPRKAGAGIATYPANRKPGGFDDVPTGATRFNPKK